jgi:hypothetical protein
MIEIDLARCQHDPTPLDCAGLALREFETLHHPKYEQGVSVMALPDKLSDHFATHRTFRKRVVHATRLGYYVERVEPRDRYEELLEINTSMPSRQGRLMDDSYVKLVRSESAMPEIACRLHHAIMYGILQRGRLVGYASIYRCGDLVHVSQFLGHAAHLTDSIMYKLIAEIIREQRKNGPGFLFYNRHDSGTPGLRWMKERVGLRSEDVAWIA